MVRFDEKTKITGPLFLKEPTMTGDKFLWRKTLRHILMRTVCSQMVHHLTSVIAQSV
jgi:hypothetical protein